jgi:uncharacterized membrane protein
LIEIGVLLTVSATMVTMFYGFAGRTIETIAAERRSMSWLASHFNYVVVVILMMAGLFIVFSSGNLIKRMIGLAMFQTSTGLFYISAQQGLRRHGGDRAEGG